MKVCLLLLFPALLSILSAAPGTLTINGNLTVRQGAVVKIEAAGTTPGSQHDEIRVGGSITLVNGGTPDGPTLLVSAIGGYTGANGDVLDIFDFTSWTGSFETVTLPPGGWRTTSLPTAGELVYLPSAGFSAWLGMNGLTGASDDDDHDSLPNLAEYALGGIPVAGAGSDSTSLLPVPVAAPDGQDRKLNFEFLLPDAPPDDVKYTVQAQNGLTGTWTDLATKAGAGPWSGAATVAAGLSASGHTAYTLEDVSLLTAAPVRFMRLKIELVP